MRHRPGPGPRFPAGGTFRADARPVIACPRLPFRSFDHGSGSQIRTSGRRRRHGYRDRGHCPDRPEGHRPRRHLLDERPDPDGFRPAHRRRQSRPHGHDAPDDGGRAGRGQQVADPATGLRPDQRRTCRRPPAASSPADRGRPAVADPETRAPRTHRTRPDPARLPETERPDADLLGLRRTRAPWPAGGHRFRQTGGGTDARGSRGPQWCRFPQHVAALGFQKPHVRGMAQRKDPRHRTVSRVSGR